MKNNYSNFCIILVFSFLSAAILLSTQTAAAAGENTGIKIMKKELVENYLTDGNGMALYYYTKDEENISHCIEGCALNWPPFYVDPSAVIEGCDVGNFAAITRIDGRQQTTYKGMPLYYFKNDKYPGDIFGHGIGEVWFLVTP